MKIESFQLLIRLEFWYVEILNNSNCRSYFFSDNYCNAKTDRPCVQGKINLNGI